MTWSSCCATCHIFMPTDSCNSAIAAACAIMAAAAPRCHYSNINLFEIGSKVSPSVRAKFDVQLQRAQTSHVKTQRGCRGGRTQKGKADQQQRRRGPSATGTAASTIVVIIRGELGQNELSLIQKLAAHGQVHGAKPSMQHSMQKSGQPWRQAQQRVWQPNPLSPLFQPKPQPHTDNPPPPPPFPPPPPQPPHAASASVQTAAAVAKVAPQPLNQSTAPQAATRMKNVVPGQAAQQPSNTTPPHAPAPSHATSPRQQLPSRNSAKTKHQASSPGPPSLRRSTRHKIDSVSLVLPVGAVQVLGQELIREKCKDKG